MAKGVNKVFLIGNLGQDPDTRYMPNGAAVSNISIATSEQWKDKETGEQQERTEWHRVVFFNRLAEIVGEYLKKGSKVYVEGTLRTRKWDDKEGITRYTTEVVAREMQMLDTGGGDGQGAKAAAQADSYPEGNRSAQANAYRDASGGTSNKRPPPIPNDYENFDDDIPF